MDGSFFIGRWWCGLLLGQLDHTSGDALEFSHVLTTFADDATYLGTRYENLNSQSDIFSARDKALLPHLLENQVLSL